MKSRIEDLEFSLNIARNKYSKAHDLIQRVFVEAGRSQRKPDEGCTIYVTADMIGQARELLGVG